MTFLPRGTLGPVGIGFGNNDVRMRNVSATILTAGDVVVVDHLAAGTNAPASPTYKFGDRESGIYGTVNTSTSGRDGANIYAVILERR